MNKDQGGGIVERVIYGAILFLVMKFGGKFGLSSDDAAWIAGGGVALAGGAYAWYHNRPVAVMNRAGNAIPNNTELVIVPTAAATRSEKHEANELAKASSEKVTAQTTS